MEREHLFNTPEWMQAERRSLRHDIRELRSSGLRPGMAAKVAKIIRGREGMDPHMLTAPTRQVTVNLMRSSFAYGFTNFGPIVLDDGYAL